MYKNLLEPCVVKKKRNHLVFSCTSFESKDSQSSWGRCTHTRNRSLKRQPAPDGRLQPLPKAWPWLPRTAFTAWLKTAVGSTSCCVPEADESSRLKARVSSFDPLAQRNFLQWSAAHQLRTSSLLQTGPLNKAEGRAKTHLTAFCSKYVAHFFDFTLYVHMYCVLILSSQRWLISGCFLNVGVFLLFWSPFKIKHVTLPHMSPGEEAKKAQQMLVSYCTDVRLLNILLEVLRS